MCLAHGLLAQDLQFSAAEGSPFLVGARPTIVRVDALDDDEHADIVVAHSQPPGISTWLGRGDGTFGSEARARLDLKLEPTEMAVGDLDGDNVTDVVVGNHDSYSVFVYYGRGDGGFRSPPRTVTMREGDQPHTHGLALADVDDDGLLDILTVNHEDGDLTIALNKGDGDFSAAPGSPVSVGPSPYPLGVGDVNGDGIVDAAVPSTRMKTHGEVTVLVGDGGGRFSSQVVQVRTPRPWFAAIGDVTGDEMEEIVVSHWERGIVSVVAWDPNSGGLTEAAGSPHRASVSAFEVTVADLNGDEVGDVLGVAGDVVAVILGDAAGSLAPAVGSPYGTGGNAWRVAVGDVNSDGRMDVVVPNEDDATLSVLLAR